MWIYGEERVTNLEGKVAWSSVEVELDAYRVEDVAGEEGEPANEEGC